MKGKSQILQEVVQRVDFGGVNQKLEQLAKSGALKRRTTISDVLDKVRPALIAARENKVSFMALAEFLKGSGIPVSEPTLRNYLHVHLGKRKRTKRPVAAAAPAAVVPEKNKPEPAPKPAPPVVPVAAASSSANGGNGALARKLPPRLARNRPV